MDGDTLQVARVEALERGDGIVECQLCVAVLAGMGERHGEIELDGWRVRFPQLALQRVRRGGQPLAFGLLALEDQQSSEIADRMGQQRVDAIRQVAEDEDPLAIEPQRVAPPVEGGAQIGEPDIAFREPQRVRPLRLGDREGFLQMCRGLGEAPLSDRLSGEPDQRRPAILSRRPARKPFGRRQESLCNRFHARACSPETPKDVRLQNAAKTLTLGSGTRVAAGDQFL